MSRYYRHNPDEPIRHDWTQPGTRIEQSMVGRDSVEPPPISYHDLNPGGEHRYACAIVRVPINPEARDAVYARLDPNARHHPILAKRWRVWSVMCTDDWALRHASLNKPPKCH